MNKRTFWILLMTSFSAMLGISIISPFLPVFAERHGANGFWLGLIFTGFGISRAVIMPVIGKISDRAGRKIFVTLGLLIFTVISLFYPIANGVVALTVVRLIHGFALGMIMPIVLAYVGDLAEEGKEAVRAATLNTTFYLGLAAGPLLGGLINQYHGFDAVFHTMSVLGLLNFFIVLVFLPDSRSPAPEKSLDRGRFNVLIRYNFIKAVLITAILITLMMTVFISFVPSLAEHIDVNTAHIGFLISLGIFLAGVLQIPFGKLADKFDQFGKSFQVSIGITVSMFALLAMPFCPDFAALLAAGAFVGIGVGISVPALSGISIGIGRKTGMGTWMGIYYAVQSLAFVITPVVFGITMDYLGIDSVFYLVAIICFFGGLSYAYYLRKRLKGIK